MNSNSKIIVMQWIVIAVLVAGSAAMVIMLVRSNDSTNAELNGIKGDNASLREQVRQSKLSPTPTVVALPEAIQNR